MHSSAAKGQGWNSKAKKEKEGAELGFIRTFSSSLGFFSPLYCRNFSFLRGSAQYFNLQGVQFVSPSLLQREQPKQKTQNKTKKSSHQEKKNQTKNPKKNPIKTRNPAVFTAFFCPCRKHRGPAWGGKREMIPLPWTEGAAAFPKFSHHFHPIPWAAPGQGNPEIHPAPLNSSQDLRIEGNDVPQSH